MTSRQCSGTINVACNRSRRLLASESSGEMADSGVFLFFRVDVFIRIWLNQSPLHSWQPLVNLSVATHFLQFWPATSASSNPTEPLRLRLRLPLLLPLSPKTPSLDFPLPTKGAFSSSSTTRRDSSERLIRRVSGNPLKPVASRVRASNIIAATVDSGTASASARMAALAASSSSIFQGHRHCMWQLAHVKADGGWHVASGLLAHVLSCPCPCHCHCLSRPCLCHCQCLLSSSFPLPWQRRAQKLVASWLVAS